MNVVAINGSPKKEGNTYFALRTMADEMEKDGISTEIIHVGGMNIRGCTACGACRESADSLCAFDDDALNGIALKMRRADGILLGSPTYYGSIAGNMKCFLDRAFYTSSAHFSYKVGAAVAVVRRTGGLGTLHQLENYLNLGRTVMPPSMYWTVVHGMQPGEVAQDTEGIQTIRGHAQAMSWLLRCLEAARATVPTPPVEERVRTNFIR